MIVAVTLTVAGCGGSATSARPDVAQTPAPVPTTAPVETPATRALKSLQASVADLGAVEVSGGTWGSPSAGLRSGTSDLRTGDFSATISLGKGLSMKMLRHADLTWSMAPPVYWSGVGYTKASARAAKGKWVVGPVAPLARMIAAMDPAVLVRGLLNFTPANLVGVAPVTRGALRGNRVLTFSSAGMTQRVYFTPGDEPRLVRLTSTKDGATTWVDFVSFPQQFRVRLPRARDVLQPDESRK